MTKRLNLRAQQGWEETISTNILKAPFTTLRKLISKSNFRCGLVWTEGQTVKIKLRFVFGLFRHSVDGKHLMLVFSVYKKKVAE